MQCDETPLSIALCILILLLFRGAVQYCMHVDDMSMVFRKGLFD